MQLLFIAARFAVAAVGFYFMLGLTYNREHKNVSDQKRLMISLAAGAAATAISVALKCQGLWC